MSLNVWVFLALGITASILALVLYLLRPGGYHPPIHRHHNKETDMSKLKHVGGYIAVGVIVMAVFGSLLELSGWHLGEKTGGILVLALGSTFMMCWMSDEIPRGLRAAIAIDASICWLGLVITAHLGHGFWGRGWAIAIAVIAPLMLCALADGLYAVHRDDKTLRSALN